MKFNLMSDCLCGCFLSEILGRESNFSALGLILIFVGCDVIVVEFRVRAW
jgi:hypothetical protein